MMTRVGAFPGLPMSSKTSKSLAGQKVRVVVAFCVVMMMMVVMGLQKKRPFAAAPRLHRRDDDTEAPLRAKKREARARRISRCSSPPRRRRGRGAEREQPLWRRQREKSAAHAHTHTHTRRVRLVCKKAELLPRGSSFLGAGCLNIGCALQNCVSACVCQETGSSKRQVVVRVWAVFCVCGGGGGVRKESTART